MKERFSLFTQKRLLTRPRCRWSYLALHHLLTNASPAVNGIRPSIFKTVDSSWNMSPVSIIIFLSPEENVTLSGSGEKYAQINEICRWILMKSQPEMDYDLIFWSVSSSNSFMMIVFLINSQLHLDMKISRKCIKNW